jgi:hypothetical protein
MADIYLLGHGAWRTVGKSNIYTQVPKGTSVVFYTPIGRFISSRQTSAIMLGAQNRLRPYQEFTEFKTCPNVILSDGVFKIEALALLASGVRFARVIERTPLSALLIKYGGNRLHWLACQPRLGGLDTEEGGFNDDYFP